MKQQLPEMPPGIAALCVDDRGWPVPWFVSWRIDRRGPDFRAVDAGKVGTALRMRICWCCGQKLGETAVFLVGPMCGINRISSEPPSCHDCAGWAVRACPFLLNPNMRRMPSEAGDQEVGVMLKHNPGVTLLWQSESWEPFRVDGGVLIDIGDPISAVWAKEGRAATREEVDASIAGGIGALRAMAREEGTGAAIELAERELAFSFLLPEVET